MNGTLPAGDGWGTKYNYETGSMRLAAVGKGRVKVFADNAGFGKRVLQIQITPTGKEVPVIGQIKHLSRFNTLHYAMFNIDHWGREDAERVLSAVPEGTLYYNILHIFGSFRACLDMYDQYCRLKAELEKCDPLASKVFEKAMVSLGMLRINPEKRQGVKVCILRIFSKEEFWKNSAVWIAAYLEGAKDRRYDNEYIAVKHVLWPLFFL